MESGLDLWPNASAFILILMKASVMELECGLMEKPFCLGAVFPVGMQEKRWVGVLCWFLWVWTSAWCDINIRKCVCVCVEDEDEQGNTAVCVGQLALC